MLHGLTAFVVLSDPCVTILILCDYSAAVGSRREGKLGGSLETMLYHRNSPGGLLRATVILTVFRCYTAAAFRLPTSLLRLHTGESSLPRFMSVDLTIQMLTFHLSSITHLPVRLRARPTQADRTYLRKFQINRSAWTVLVMLDACTCYSL